MCFPCDKSMFFYRFIYNSSPYLYINFPKQTIIVKVFLQPLRLLRFYLTLFIKNPRHLSGKRNFSAFCLHNHISYTLFSFTASFGTAGLSSGIAPFSLSSTLLPFSSVVSSFGVGSAFAKSSGYSFEK